MKKLFTLIALLGAMALILSFSAAAGAETGTCGENLTWTLDDAGLLTISGTGEMTSAPWADDAIRDRMTGVFIGKGVTSIHHGYDAIKFFDSCEKLNRIDVESGNTVYASRDGVLFNQDFTQLVRYPRARKGSTYTIPDGVKGLQNGAFHGCDLLTGVTFPNSVTWIGGFCFCGCDGLTEVRIPKNVTEISREAFEDCGNLRSVRMEGVTQINWCTFAGCVNLTDVFLPDCLTAICEGAFGECDSLKRIVIPAGVTTIASYAFQAIPNLTICCYSGSEAEKYADENGIAKILLDDVAVPPDLYSVAFSKQKATVKQNVTITAETSRDAVRLIMFAGSTRVKAWTGGYTDSGDTRTWKLTYAFSGAGERELTFQAENREAEASAPRKAKITVTKAPTLSSVKFAKARATVKQNVTITAVTNPLATKLTMYAGGKAVKTWTTGYTDKDGKRTWKVTYAFQGAGKRTLSFKAADANGMATAAKNASIEIVK